MTGVLTSLTVRVSRKLGDKDFGSYGGEWEATVNLPPDANLSDESEALFAFGKAFLGGELATMAVDIKKMQDLVASQQPELMPAPQPIKPAPEVERVPVDDDGNEFKDIKVDFIKVVFSEKGEKRARAFGKPFDKFGVVTYPEALEAVGFDLDAAEPGNYALPAPYTTARILLGGKNEKGFDIPKKVDHFVK